MKPPPALLVKQAIDLQQREGKKICRHRRRRTSSDNKIELRLPLFFFKKFSKVHWNAWFQPPKKKKNQIGGGSSGSGDYFSLVSPPYSHSFSSYSGGRKKGKTSFFFPSWTSFLFFLFLFRCWKRKRR